MSAPIASRFDVSTNKCVVVLAEELGGGIAVNVAAVLALAVGVRVGFPLGDDVSDASGSVHSALPRVGLPLLRATAQELAELRGHACERGLVVVDYTEAALTPDYDDYRQALASASTGEHRYLGLALAGTKRAVNSLAGNLRLFR
jgi:hypothetical protein